MRLKDAFLSSLNCESTILKFCQHGASVYGKEKIAAEGEKEKKEEKEATNIEPVPTWTREKP